MMLEAIEAISRVKYTYFRLLDTKQFDQLSALFIEEATAYQSAPRPYTGRGDHSAGSTAEPLALEFGGHGASLPRW